MQKSTISSVALGGCPVTGQSEAMSDGPSLSEQVSTMGRIVAFLFGVVAYLVFLGTFLYAIGFVGGIGGAEGDRHRTVVPLGEALIVNVLLLSLFAVQHSVMARKPFKRWWTQFVPASIERSTYVLLASLALILLFWQWRPMPAIVWQVTNPALAMALIGAVVGRLAARAAQHVPDQPFRAVRPAAGHHQSRRPDDAGAALQDADALQARAAPDLSRLHHRVLGGAGDDASAICCSRR